LFLNGKRFRIIEAIVALLILVIAVCFAVQIGLSKPAALPLFTGFLPTPDIFSNKKMLFIGIGILGATVMPHNLFLHSSIILTRNVPDDEKSIRSAIQFGIIDSTGSLTIALFVNAAILIVAAATFHKNGYNDVATLEEAYKLLDPVLKSNLSSVIFGIALLASGQNSTLTGTLTGQIVMEGFLFLK
jgi:manganese transport protein